MSIVNLIVVVMLVVYLGVATYKLYKVDSGKDT